MPKEKVTITIDSELVRGVKYLAKRELRSLSNMIEYLIKKALGMINKEG